AYKEQRAALGLSPNPTNAVGGFVQALPTRSNGRSSVCLPIPPTQFVDSFTLCLQRKTVVHRIVLQSHQRSWWIRSSSAYKEQRAAVGLSPNPTNAVGGFVQALPTRSNGRPSVCLPIPPTQLVDSFRLCLQRKVLARFPFLPKSPPNPGGIWRGF